MPIKPENKYRYPKNWDRISMAIKERAEWRCECFGECGRDTHEGRCPNRHGGIAYGTGSRVVLTTAHLDHTPENCDAQNLRAMCQGCHLHYDKSHHAETRRAPRALRDMFAPDVPMIAPPPSCPPPRRPRRRRTPPDAA